jgi:TPR repeat protein
MANLYLSGNLLSKNETKAVQLFTSAAEKGNTIAAYKLGQCYKKGIGIPQNDQEAFKLFTKTEFFNPDAKYDLAVMMMEPDKHYSNLPEGTNIV